MKSLHCNAWLAIACGHYKYPDPGCVLCSALTLRSEGVCTPEQDPSCMPLYFTPFTVAKLRCKEVEFLIHRPTTSKQPQIFLAQKAHPTDHPDSPPAGTTRFWPIIILGGLTSFSSVPW